MYLRLVDLQVNLLDEALPAIETLVRPLAGVYPHMHLQFGQTGKLIPANMAGVLLLLFSHPRLMGPLVHGQRSPVGALELASRATVNLRVLVYPHVGQQGGLVETFEAADPAPVLFMARDVLHQFLGRNEIPARPAYQPKRHGTFMAIFFIIFNLIKN